MPPGMGMASSGTSAEAVRTCDHYTNRMREYEKIIKTNISEIVTEIKKHGVETKSVLSFSLKIEGNKVYAYESDLDVNVLLGGI
jgi:uncharacterized protein (UPF0335 family)